jgi:hypothetical protein
MNCPKCACPCVVDLSKRKKPMWAYICRRCDYMWSKEVVSESK